MAHVRLHQMSRGQRRTQRELASQYSCRDNTSQLAGVLTWVRGVRASYAEKVEHGGLWFEDGAAADGADFDAGHADRDLEVAV